MTALAVTLAMAADLLTANASHERNPLAAAVILAGFALPAKLAETALVLAVVAIARRWRPGPLAGIVAGLAIGAGMLGAASNLG